MDLSTFPVRNGFRQRGAHITRLETFADAAFAFAVTVLVIAGGEIPGSFEALMESLKEIPSFAASFALLLMFWHGHVQWSRRFGLEDGGAVVISGLLIFTVLVYMVPLKVLFGQMFAWMSGGFLGQTFELDAPRRQLPELFVVYALGYTAMCSLMCWLNAYAYRLHDELRLNELERFWTRVTIWQWGLIGFPGLISLVMAAATPPSISIWSGFPYMLLPIVMPIFGHRVTRLERKYAPQAA